MSWPVLILAVPIVIVPAVCLLGFAGCSYQPPAPLPMAADPSDFTATADVAEHISLTWRDNGTNTTHFNLRRREDNGPTIVIESIPATPGTPPVFNQYLDSLGLMPLTTYEYELYAVVGDIESTGLVMAHVTTPAN